MRSGGFTVAELKIMVVDDDSNICELLRLYLEKEGYEAVIAENGVKALSLYEALQPDLILLDVMMPELDGWQVCRELRKHSDVPIIMLTAKGEVFDKVLGLELGADDFVVKPFDMKELSARVKAVLRRYQSHKNPNTDEVIKFDNIEISKQKYELKLRGKSIDIPPKELELLYFLASNYNHVFTRDQLLDKVWSFDYLGDSRTVDVHVKRLREKLEGVSDKWVLKTVWGVGYKFELLD
jgi:DNA-binding response OmpR family regulator